jgi:hypothetical protein
MRFIIRPRILLLFKPQERPAGKDQTNAKGG